MGGNTKGQPAALPLNPLWVDRAVRDGVLVNQKERGEDRKARGPGAEAGAAPKIRRFSQSSTPPRKGGELLHTTSRLLIPDP